MVGTLRQGGETDTHQESQVAQEVPGAREPGDRRPPEGEDTRDITTQCGQTVQHQPNGGDADHPVLSLSAILGSTHSGTPPGTFHRGTRGLWTGPQPCTCGTTRNQKGPQGRAHCPCSAGRSPHSIASGWQPQRRQLPGALVFAAVTGRCLGAVRTMTGCVTPAAQPSVKADEHKSCRP